MRIVSVTLDYAESNGGSAETVRQFADALGCETLSFTAAGLLPDAIRDRGVRHIPVSGPGTFYGHPGRRGAAEAEAFLRGADFVFCHKLFRYHDGWVRRVAERHGIPYCVVPHGSLDPYVFTYRALRKRLWLASLGARVFAGAAGVLFATRRERNTAGDFLAGGRSWVVNWPVPRGNVANPEGARREMRERLGIAAADRVLLFLGRLHSMKRPKETIDAFRRAAVPGSHLIVAGPDGDCTAAGLREYARGAANVHVTGPVYGEAKWALYHAADTFVNFSARENFGYTVGEALTAGVPVVLSPGNALADDLAGVGCGWLLWTDREDEFAGSLSEVLRAPIAKLRALGERGREWALANTSLERFRSRLLTVIEEATCGC